MSTQSDTTIIDEQYLLNLGLSRAWVAKHSRAMGCFARKPRRFFLAQVMAHLQFLAAEAQARAQGRKAQKIGRLHEVRSFANTVTRKNKRMTDGAVFDFVEYFEGRSRA